MTAVVKIIPTTSDHADTERRWSVELMKRIMRLGRLEFATGDCYQFEEQLKRLFPNNRVDTRATIRGYLQRLRDAGFLENPERDVWRNNLLQD